MEGVFQSFRVIRVKVPNSPFPTSWQNFRKFWWMRFEELMRAKFGVHATRTIKHPGPLPRRTSLTFALSTRPPRGQAWPHGRSWSWIRRFQLNLFGILSTLILSSHLIVIWQCPSGTAFEDNILQFNSFSVHLVFHRSSGLRTEKFSELRFISVSILWGRAPQKLLTLFFQILEKILSPKKSKNFFSILGQKIMQIDVIWSQGYGKIVFLSKNWF